KRVPLRTKKKYRTKKGNSFSQRSRRYSTSCGPLTKLPMVACDTAEATGLMLEQVIDCLPEQLLLLVRQILSQQANLKRAVLTVVAADLRHIPEGRHRCSPVELTYVPANTVLVHHRHRLFAGQLREQHEVLRLDKA